MTDIVKNTRFILHSLTPCVRCRGKAWIKNPIYDKFDEWKKDFVARNRFAPSRMEAHTWWVDHGHKKGFPDDPEIQCPDCKGQGELSQDIELQDALKAIEAMENCQAIVGQPCECGHHHIVEDPAQ